MKEDYQLLADTILCKHQEWVYVSKMLLYQPQPAKGGRVYTVEVICKQCNRKLVGQLQEVK